MTQWEKKHWRIERRGIVRASVDADAIGFPEAAQVIAVKRECIELDPRLEDAKPEKEKKSKNKGNKKKYKNSNEKLFYISSLPLESTSDAEMLEIIRGHWTSIENGTHLMRDVSYDEDKCRISKKKWCQSYGSVTKSFHISA